jgi:CMP-N,N'-diacetyllegionaminic acid synthase
MSSRSVLAIIPARGGSKGLPGKNVRPFAGLPLIVHSIRFARLCPEIDRCVLSTDSEEIAELARASGGEVPFLRPPELAEDSTPMLLVVQHAVHEVERRDRKQYDIIALLQPTSPFRLPEDLSRGLRMLESDSNAVGVISASEPVFNPRSVCVEDQNGYMAWAFAKTAYTRRQDAEPVYRVNGMLYLWRREHILNASVDTLYTAPHRLLIVPEERALDIDALHDFHVGEALLRSGIIQLPWCNGTRFELLEQS